MSIEQVVILVNCAQIPLRIVKLVMTLQQVVMIVDHLEEISNQYQEALNMHVMMFVFTIKQLVQLIKIVMIAQQ